MLDNNSRFPSHFEAERPRLCDTQSLLKDHKWYAVYTIPRHEKRLAERFTARSIEHFLPVYRAQRRWKDGSRVNLDLPLFPNYIFVHICAQQRPSVLAVPGTLTIVGNRREPAALLDSEIEALRKAADPTKVEPHPYLVVGQRARITNGPFAGMEGVLLRKKNGLRVVLTLSVIQESVAVELDACDLVPTNPGYKLSESAWSAAA